MALRNHNVSRSGRRVCGTPLSGVAAALVPSTGTNGPGYLYDLIATLSIGPAVQMTGRVGTIPAGVTMLAANEPSDFEAEGVDGTHIVPFTLLLDGIRFGSVDDYTFSLTYGDTDITGTGSSTQAPNTSSASGTVATVGTVARTQAPDTSSASGSVTTPITGTGASTQAPNTSTASGTLGGIVTGTVARTQAPNTSSASGTVTTFGTGASTQAANTSAASGTVTNFGSGASTQAANTSVASGLVLSAITGTVARTQAPNVSAAAGLVTSGIAGIGASTQAANVSAASGIVVADAQSIVFRGDPNNNVMFDNGWTAILVSGQVAMIV